MELMICIAVGLALYVMLWWQVQIIRVRRLTRWQTKSRHRGKNPGYIYFFRGRHENPFIVKIGRAVNASQRMKAHRTANPHGVDVLCVFKTEDDRAAEAFLHKEFAEHRIASDNEWFGLSLKLLLWMAWLKNKDMTIRVQNDLG